MEKTPTQTSNTQMMYDVITRTRAVIHAHATIVLSAVYSWSLLPWERGRGYFEPLSCEVRWSEPISASRVGPMTHPSRGCRSMSQVARTSIGLA